MLSGRQQIYEEGIPRWIKDGTNKGKSNLVLRLD